MIVKDLLAALQKEVEKDPAVAEMLVAVDTEARADQAHFYQAKGVWVTSPKEKTGMDQFLYLSLEI